MTIVKLSIIVPVYRVEQYLRKCVDSLLMQDILPSEYELILVDDDSPDTCPTICDEYATMSRNGAGTYPVIHVIHQVNAGLSAARNSGLRIAQGQYILFVDSDDYLQPNVISTLLAQMDRERLDVLRFDYQYVNSQYEIYWPYKTPKQPDMRTDIVSGETYLNERLGYRCYAWQFMIRRTLLDDCLFKEGILFEDTEWTPRMLLKALRVNSSNIVVYNYLVREGSITNEVDPIKQHRVLKNKIALIDSLQAIAPQAHDARWFGGMIAANVVSIMGIIATSFWAERSEFLRALQEKNIYPLSYYQCTTAGRRKIRMINSCPRLYCWLLYVKNKK